MSLFPKAINSNFIKKYSMGAKLLVYTLYHFHML